MTRYLIWLGVAVLSFLGLMAGLTAIALLSLPDVTKLRGCITTEMFKVRLCPGSEGYSRLNEISPHMIASVIISEDAAFYQHNGFDFDEMRNSFNRNLEEGGFVRGGSTISQQLVKNVFLSQEKSITRKLKEAFLTYELEKTFRKNEILERYLNVVEFGRNLYGVKAASGFYFGKTPSQLNVLESAFLTTLLPNPKKYSVSHRQGKLSAFMRSRVLTIARKLQATHRITESDYRFAVANVDGFPWKGLGGAAQTTDAVLNSIEDTNFSEDSSGGTPELVAQEMNPEGLEPDVLAPEPEPGP